MKLRIAILAVVFGLSAAAATSQATPAPSSKCPPDPQLARLIAGSALVVIGQMEVPKQQLIEEAQKPSPDFLDISVKIESVIKGSSAESAIVRFYPRDASYKPSNNAVLGLAGAQAILFLTMTCSPFSGR